ncbi:MAG: isoprenylcysteine carboxylmethyltransferase family protein [Candidatus Aminicenantes bacterium]|nr:isoprenylcysteine carboxylmethyltransferase family protein [Candidatus Aminicenantes bacterium]
MTPPHVRKYISGVEKKVASACKLLLRLAFIALIFVVAGTLDWPRLWLILGFYAVTTSALMLWLKKRNPGLLEERMTVKKDVKGWDKTIIRIYTVLLMVMYIVLPLDAVRFGWSSVPAALSWLAFSGIFLSWVVVFWAFRENAYLSAFVRVQTDRGHAVCTTGPYRFVRHPMYLAVILAILCVPLFLNSLFSLIPAVLIVGLFVLRTSLEDRTLQAELSGYAEYAAKTRWKLVPKVW